jgi:hypothetical protein
MNRTLLAGILAGVAMFAWASIAHIALPLGTVGVSEIPGEPAVLNSMQAALGNNDGLYIFPAMGPDNDMTAYAHKLALSPSGLLIYRAPGAKPLEPSQLVIEFLTETLEALIAIWLLTKTRINGYLRRVGFFAVLGVICSLGTNLSYWNWYGFPASYTIVYMMIQVVGFVCAGLVAAAMIRNLA